MAKIMQACDALNEAIDSNKGLATIVDLMLSANESDPIDPRGLAEVLMAIHQAIGGHLDQVRRNLV